MRGVKDGAENPGEKNAQTSLSVTSFLLRFRWAYLAGFLVLLGNNSLALTIPWTLKLAIDNVQHHPERGFLILCAEVMIVVALLQAALRIVSRIILFGVGRDVEADIRQRIYDQVQRLDAAFFQRSTQGEVVSLLTSDPNFIRLFFGMGFLNLFNGMILYVLSAALMLSLNARLALWALAPYVLFVLILRRITPDFHRRSRGLQEELSKLTEFVQENLSGHEVLQNFQRGEVMIERFAVQNQAYLKAAMALARVRTALFTSTSAIAGLGMLSLLAVGGSQVIQGKIGLGDFVAFSGYLSMLVTPTLMFGFVISVWNRGRASLERIRDFLGRQPLIVEPALSQPPSGEPSIQIENLSFTYPDTKEQVLQDISCEIPAGRLTALVGPVGSGKSSLAALLLKTYPVTTGRIRMGGADLEELTSEEVRRQIAIVPQDVFLFSMTVGENIAFGVPPERSLSPEALEKEILEAADTAQIGLARGERGLDQKTLVGERGVLVSGGQRQRLGIARALVARSPILILDEPFSSLDAETSQHVLDSLEKRLKGQTVLLITHRVSLLRRAHQILLLDQGVIQDRGTHTELMERSAIYRDLYALEEFMAHEVQ